MNWYSIFYWLTVADGVKSFFDTSSNIFSWFAVITFIAYMFIVGFHAAEVSSYSDTTNDAKALSIWRKALKTGFLTFFIMAIICWGGWIFTPSKKDALIIIAGGAVGNFVTKDSSSKKIPSEVMLLLSEKIKSEIHNTKMSDFLNDKKVKDTLADKSKEELLKIIRDKDTSK